MAKDALNVRQSKWFWPVQPTRLASPVRGSTSQRPSGDSTHPSNTFSATSPRNRKLYVLRFENARNSSPRFNDPTAATVGRFAV